MPLDAAALIRLRDALRSCLTDTPDSLDHPSRAITLRRRIEECDRALEALPAE